MAEVSSSHVSIIKLWASIILGFVISLVVMVACAYLWVFLYSMFINSAGDQAFYEAYAQVASPVVAVVVSFPVFFLLGRYMRRFGSKARFAAFAAVAINLIVDALAVAVVPASADVGFMIAMSTLSALGKIGGAYVGSKPPVA